MATSRKSLCLTWDNETFDDRAAYYLKIQIRNFSGYKSSNIWLGGSSLERVLLDLGLKPGGQIQTLIPQSLSHLQSEIHIVKKMGLRHFMFGQVRLM